MSKLEIIDHIRRINATAQAEFLSSFADNDLLAYLRQLQEVQREQRYRLSSGASFIGNRGDFSSERLTDQHIGLPPLAHTQFIDEFIGREPV
jgi:hypothetical protein